MREAAASGRGETRREQREREGRDGGGGKEMEWEGPDLSHPGHSMPETTDCQPIGGALENRGSFGTCLGDPIPHSITTVEMP